MSQPPIFRGDYGDYPEEFFTKIRRQVNEDHAAVRERNRKKRAVWAQSPAMQMASSLIQGPFGLEPEGEAEYDALLDRMGEALMREPLVKRYTNHLSGSNIANRSNTEWWHALGHQYMVAVSWTLATTRDEVAGKAMADMPFILDERLWQTDAFNSVGPREISFEWAGRCLESKTYLWHQNTLDASLAAPLVPHVVQPNALPFESLFFSFESVAFSEHRTADGQRDPFAGEHQVMTPDGKFLPYRVETWWMQISAIGDAGIMLLFDRQYWPLDAPGYVPQTHIIFEPIPWGARWPEDFENRPFKHQIGALLRMLAFMQAPFVDTTLLERKLPRPIRREYDRLQKQAPLKEVSIITLRAKLYEPMYRNGVDGEANGDGRKYSHSWWVNGHYRWQWYPSEQTHRLIAIAPYMKQIGKPLLAQIRDVSR